MPRLAGRSSGSPGVFRRTKNRQQLEPTNESTAMRNKQSIFLRRKGNVDLRPLNCWRPLRCRADRPALLTRH
jgi:hypothetical protein